MCLFVVVWCIFYYIKYTLHYYIYYYVCITLKYFFNTFFIFKLIKVNYNIYILNTTTHHATWFSIDIDIYNHCHIYIL